MLPPHHLLLDNDGDGHFDSLSGAVYVNTSAGTKHISAAAEFVAWLAQKALRLPLDIRAWSPSVPAVFIGKHPPENVPAVSRGAALYFGANSLLLVAATEEDLLESAQRLNGWPLQTTLQTLLQDLSAGTRREPLVESLVYQEGGVTLRLAVELANSFDWSALPPDLVELVTPTAHYANLCARTHRHAPKSQGERQRFSLAQAFQGGGLFTGSRYGPEHLTGGLSIEAPIQEALDVAARLSVEGLQSPHPLTRDPGTASVRIRFDAASDAEVRIHEGTQGSVVEVVGNSAQTLARAATYFAHTFPHLPDGTDLEGLEQGLTRFLNGETPFGRVSMVAALQQQSRIRARRALLPNPPPAAPRLLNLPVTNTARDGKQTRWEQTFAWEGRRLLELLHSAKWKRGEEVVIEGFLSETRSVRETLAHHIEVFCKEQGVTADVRLRSAYKPGLCWLLEDIGPKLIELKAEALHICCAEHHRSTEASDRWLRELYPVAEILEQRYGVQVSLELADSEEVYQVTAFDGGGNTVLDAHLTPPTSEAPLNGIHELGSVTTTTGQVTIRQGSALLLHKRLPTDRDLFWTWFTETVIPTVQSTIVPDDRGPYFGELSVVVLMSEPDEPLGLDHEHLSATESLHEDIYFGTLEALHHAAKLDTADRSLSPGRVLPFCKADETGDTSAQVALRGLGSHKLGLLDTAGRVHEVQRYSFDTRVTAIQLLADASLHLHLAVRLADMQAAQTCKAQLEWALSHREQAGFWDPFLREGDITLRLEVGGKTLDPIHIPKLRCDPQTSSLPNRQLLTREVVHHAQGLARKLPNVHLRALSESQGGEPLVALELNSATSYTSRARSAAWKPTVLISARQHANEPTSTNAMFSWLEEELSRGSLFNRVNVVFHPLENPDGARLHQALSQLSARHMHHAARYTAVGADLQTNPTSRGVIIPESRLRLDTWKRWQPGLHLNCHGYPAHEWLRANGGYMPRHFEAWSLPFGYFTILAGNARHEKLLQRLQSSVAEALTTRPHLQHFTAQQIQRALRYLKSSIFPFSLEKGFPFLATLQDREPEAHSTTAFAPAVTVITEVPDETVSSTLWQWCLEAHQVIGETVIRVMYDYQENPRQTPEMVDRE